MVRYKFGLAIDDDSGAGATTIYAKLMSLAAKSAVDYLDIDGASVLPLVRVRVRVRVRVGSGSGSRSGSGSGSGLGLTCW